MDNQAKRNVVIIESVSNGFLVTKQDSNKVLVYTSVTDATDRAKELLSVKEEQPAEKKVTE